MTPWMRWLHKWVGLLIGLQFVLWMASGLMMGLLPHDEVQGHEFRAHAAAPRAWPADVLTAGDVLKQAGPAQVIVSGWLLDRPVYQALDGKQQRVFDARTGRAVVIDRDLARELAVASYSGPGKPRTPILLDWTQEVRDHDARSWRVDFDDAHDTTVYLSAQTGEVLEHRNSTWRLFDVFWMLHIMDYANRSNFNNPLVIGAGIGGLWLALTGVWLLVASFHLREFVPRRWRRARELTVYAANGGKLRTVKAAAGDSVYVALARNGLQLPSNCGGGQSCGLCEVRYRGVPPAPTAADRAHLSESKLKIGHRLACNLPLDADMEVEVAGGASLWTEHEATVERVIAVTPFLREIVLKPAQPPGPEYQPGAYLQVHVPDYEFPCDRIVRPDEHHGDWAALDLPDTVSNREAVRRSYSLSLPIDASDGRLTLLARFSPGRQDRKRQPPGKGSTYLYTLQPGDRVNFSGPFGDFAIRPNGREKVFIGGGAGMAPLRAMIHSLLGQGARERIHYWYGARVLRDAPYVDEMASLAQRNGNFSWHLVLSEAAECDDALVRGLVHEAAHDRLLKDHPALLDCDFYLCGPPAMLAATRQLLHRLGVPDEQVAFDDFKI